MSDPYYRAKPGDPILAEDWNNMQSQARDEIRAHTHAGGDQGKQLDGSAISPTSTLKVNELHAAVNLTVKGADVLSVKGGSLSGDLSVQGKLQVTGGALVPSVGNAESAGIMFPTNPGGGSGDAAFIRYFVTQKETTVLRIGIDNDSDDTLNLYQAGQDRLILRDGNVEIPNVLRVGSGTFNNPAQVVIKANGHAGGMLALEKADGYRMLHVNNDGVVGVDRLTVFTSLKFNNLEVPRSAEAVRLVRGCVNIDNVKTRSFVRSNPAAQVKGAGWAVYAVDGSVGVYEIEFTPAFPDGDLPAVTVTQTFHYSFNETSANFTNENGVTKGYYNDINTKDNATIMVVSAKRAIIKVGNGEGTGTARHFHFIAVGLA